MDYNNQNYGQNGERELGWDDPIEKESSFILLEEGVYPFTITGFERARHSGSANLPPCNKAVLKVTIKAANGEEVTIKHNLFMHTKTEAFLSAFFTSIGQKKPGEAFRMNWNIVPGAMGRCKVTQYTGNDGNFYNQIDKFLPPENIENTSGQGYTPGKF